MIVVKYNKMCGAPQCEASLSGKILFKRDSICCRMNYNYFYNARASCKLHSRSSYTQTSSADRWWRRNDCISYCRRSIDDLEPRGWCCTQLFLPTPCPRLHRKSRRLLQRRPVRGRSPMRSFSECRRYFTPWCDQSLAASKMTTCLLLCLLWNCW